MSESRAAVAKSAAGGLRRFSSELAKHPVLVGFDGFVDSIIAVVDKRQDAKRYDRVKTIEQFGKKIVNAAGMSSNYEMVVTLEKLGGNGPIMASALSAMGLPVTYVGALGSPSLHPVFEDFAGKAEVYSVAEPGRTDALEFADGKLMLGKYESIYAVDWEHLDDHLGKGRLLDIITRSSFIGMVNWTMMLGMADIWKKMIEVFATGGDKVSKAASGNRRMQVFIDLADPEKRELADIKEALELCAKMQKHVDVTLGMNLKESSQIAAVLGVAVAGDAESAIEATAKAVCEKMGLYCVVIHPRKGAAAARRGVNGAMETATFAGPFVAEPKLSTGAGDNFNAGFSLGNLAGLSLAEALCVGTGTSGYYVRNAASPTLDQLATFCDDLPAPQAG